MRVKTPWIDALTASREAAKGSKDGKPTEPTVKPDLMPKKMSDSHYSAVCIENVQRKPLANSSGTDPAVGSRQVAIGPLPQFEWSYQTWIIADGP